MASLPVRTDRCRRWSKVSAPSVRVRTTRLAVVVVGLAMAAGMAILVHVFRESLLGELEVGRVLPRPAGEPAAPARRSRPLATHRSQLSDRAER